MTAEQYIEDIKGVVEYVRERFKKDKVIIMADSFGTCLGVRFVLQYPELVEAYIGSAQIVDIKDDYKKCQTDIIQKARSKGDEKAVKVLEDLNNTPYNVEGMLHINEVLSRYIGTYLSKEAKGDMGIMVMAGLESPYFPISHLEYYIKMGELQKRDMEYITQFSVYNYEKEYQVPTVFIYGSDDWLTRYNIEDYYSEVKAPYKKLICIQAAGHDTIQMNPEEFYNSFHLAMQELGIVTY